jgi:hypothetical protein
MFKVHSTYREPIYTFPKEKWDYKKCEKLAKRKSKDSYGGIRPQGLLWSSEIGKTCTYNGGTYVDIDNKVEVGWWAWPFKNWSGGKVEWFKSVEYPLPEIPDDFEFYEMVSWGTAIRKRI